MSCSRGKRDVKDKKKRRKKKEEESSDIAEEGEEDEEEENLMEEKLESLSVESSDKQPELSSVSTAQEESIFKVTLAESSSSQMMDSSDSAPSATNTLPEAFIPSPRMNALLCLKQGMVYMYGGVFEVGDAQYTLSDFYSLDLHKMDTWNILIENSIKEMVSWHILQCGFINFT